MQILPMPADAFAEFRARHLADQAPAFAASFGISVADARARAEATFAAMLPEGINTPGQSFFSVLDDAGSRAGHLWFQEREFFGIKKLFVADIYLSDEFRGRGLGSAVFGWLETHARQLGYTEVALHVFGANDRARRLYERLGFVPTSVQMSKRL